MSMGAIFPHGAVNIIINKGLNLGFCLWLKNKRQGNNRLAISSGCSTRPHMGIVVPPCPLSLIPAHDASAPSLLLFLPSVYACLYPFPQWILLFFTLAHE
jgi:hypothetical protein